MLLLALLACDQGKVEGDAFALGFAGPPDCVEVAMGDETVPASLTAELWVRGDPGDFDRLLPLLHWAGVFVLQEDASHMVGFQVGDEGDAAIYASSLMDGVLHHVAGTYEAGTARLWVDGALQGFVDGVAPAEEAGAALRIGCDGAGGAFEGLVDEVRISGGARYEEAFTRPAAPFEVDADTIALFHFDEGQGAASVDAVAQREATIAGPDWVEFSLGDEAE